MRRIKWVAMLIFLASAVFAQDLGAPLTLEDCVDMALKTHPSIKAAGMGQMSAVYQRRMAIASVFPVLHAEYSHTWLDEQPTFTVPGSPDMTLSGTIPPPIGPVPFSMTVPGSPSQTLPAGDDEIDSLTISATQPLFTGGALWHAWQLATLQVQDASLQVELAKMEIVYQTRRAFYGVLKATEFVRVADEALEMVQQLRQQAQDFFDVGMIAKNQLLEAEVNVAERRQNLNTAKMGLAIAKSVLNLLIGRPEQIDIEIEGELEKVPVTVTMEECVKTGLEMRPEIRSARTRAQMANHLVKIERSGWFPRVALIGAYKHEEGSFISDEDVYSLTLAAQWTFWEWGRKYFNVRSASELAAQAAQAVRMVEDRVTLEVREAYLRLREADLNIETARMGLSSADENLMVVKARFDQGMATSFDVLTAQTLLTRARTAKVSAMADYMTASAALERSMGISLEESSATTVEPETTSEPAAPESLPAETLPEEDANEIVE